MEWSFGCLSDGPHGTGIFTVPPRGCTVHSFRESVSMGATLLTPKHLEALLDQLAKDWPGAHYDLLRRNCCHFSDFLCRWLGVGAILRSGAERVHLLAGRPAIAGTTPAYPRQPEREPTAGPTGAGGGGAAEAQPLQPQQQ